jgi:hypothetical protein
VSSRPPQNGSPFWLDAVRRLERTVGVPVERFVTSDAYFDMLPQLRRAQAQLEEAVAGMTEEWYRLFNFPSGKEVRQLREQLSRVERQLDRLTKQVADGGTPRRTPRKTDQTD